MLFLLNVLLQAGRHSGGSKYSTPYDSTQGVPGFVFVGFWIIILLFGIRLAWEYRDKIFPKNLPEKKNGNKTTIAKKHDRR